MARCDSTSTPAASHFRIPAAQVAQWSTHASMVYS